MASAALARIKGVWAWAGTNKDQLTLLLALVAGVVTLLQYTSAVDDARSKETLKYVDRSQSEHIGKAHTTLNAVMLDKALRDEFDKKLIAALKPPHELSALDAFVSKHGLREHVLTLVDLYMNLAGCVKAGVCDEKLACDFFVSDITGLNNTYRPLFEKIWKERSGQNYMDGPMQFVKTCNRHAK
ncbi:hypothetical protein OOZ63_27795 [Paucibacter sp. PLA-PC-4]|uniref:DUF4760 domain-containing protein n=1 Tax=Paucibacter sp. PLA-PC-4 TaxID=2993655 RepID=UPI00224AE7B4|nr:hypothetical protein [Paucibacter sp. PLA-PC-4]MCX2865629.1 hypothetical protein [Paucibacter sp. PLA-PC-4]